MSKETMFIVQFKMCYQHACSVALILISFLFICNKFAFLEKSLYFLTYPRKLRIIIDQYTQKLSSAGNV